MCKIVKKKKEKKKQQSLFETWGMPEAVTSLVATQTFVPTLVLSRAKEKREETDKGKARTPKSQIPHQNPTS